MNYITSHQVHHPSVSGLAPALSGCLIRLTQILAVRCSVAQQVHQSAFPGSQLSRALAQSSATAPTAIISYCTTPAS